MNTFIVLPSQLCKYPKSFWKQWDQVIVVEDKYYINRKQHPLKLWMHRASMMEYFDAIPVKNKKYIEHTSAYKPPAQFTICYPNDKPMVKKYGRGTFIDPPNFILKVSELKEMDTPIQAAFYKRMRLKLGILVQNGKPKGGKWSYDSDNRLRYPTGFKEKNTLDNGFANKYITKAKAIVSISDIELRINHLPWPTNRSSALKQLRAFVKHKLNEFGPYQDAIRSDVIVGYHSCMSAAMNIGLITPDDFIGEVMKVKARIESVEALIRQIIGWREYIRMRYVLYGLQPWSYLSKMNQHLGKAWYRGTTGIEALDWSINRVLTYAYTPHIERLMLLLNYAMLLRLRYEDVRQWFINCFIDAIGEWPMLNIEMGVSSFSQHKFMTRAYINSGSYLVKQGLSISKTDMELMKQLYVSFIKDNKTLAKRDYRLAAQVKKLSVK